MSKIPYPLASRENHPENSVVQVGDIQIGGKSATIIAGPCSVESRDSYVEIAIELQKAGAQILRGGAYKPRTSPYSFQGMGEEGLRIMAEASDITGLPTISEVMDVETLPLVAHYVDILQIGARNMQNYPLLKAVGKTKKPVMLKRGLANTIEEWLMSAEYILSAGNPSVILCERGIRTFETATRFTLDLNAVPVIRKLSHLPILIDPSHGTGHSGYVPALSRAAIAVGADGIMVEVHSNPAEALSDGPQSLTVEEFRRLAPHIHQLSDFCQPFFEEAKNARTAKISVS
ncbi:3-deoxy-7-phosphoheptulonate synthase [Alicyclobacillus tolerans]|uniref:3-deoxy-7-phosphoheptulonate synthase n=2 Tax=Alicyclobacillus tolerans TaxID=90970 RepID=A0ABT9LVB1_9BACL|nr:MULTISPECIES: 3-deoxy-7-phosphoheptulonate synthase [Alicyclobacillus]MDP9728205.1 3-deoxy-7-phosphoheptulonate synthase [Alicyclobacillus tengchongensis]QRF23424.1 3-deoxy-7-phosphoheptulonate synthase [Alicyclobacillus sp. TC]SHJ83023.1 3-deoxy-D-arabinoheptulosonate-7-phosphate synthase [Alicyclobacillus montanus]